jgi:hypothetical protein
MTICCKPEDVNLNTFLNVANVSDVKMNNNNVYGKTITTNIEVINEDNTTDDLGWISLSVSNNPLDNDWSDIKIDVSKLILNTSTNGSFGYSDIWLESNGVRVEQLVLKMKSIYDKED